MSSIARATVAWCALAVNVTIRCGEWKRTRCNQSWWKGEFIMGASRFVIKVQNKSHTQKIQNVGQSKNQKSARTRNRVRTRNPEGTKSMKQKIKETPEQTKGRGSELGGEPVNYEEEQRAESTALHENTQSVKYNTETNQNKKARLEIQTPVKLVQTMLKNSQWTQVRIRLKYTRGWWDMIGNRCGISMGGGGGLQLTKIKQWKGW